MKEMTMTSAEPFALTPGMPDHLVKEGSIRVFLLPVKDQHTQRRLFLGTAMQGDVIPAPPKEALSGRLWTLLCIPVGAVSIVAVDASKPGTRIETYLDSSVFRLYGEYRQMELPVSRSEFWRTVIERYDARTEKQAESIRARMVKRTALRLDTARRVENIFHSRIRYEIATAKPTDSPLYDALAFLCHRRGVSIAPLQRIRHACPGEPGIQDIARLSGFACRMVRLKPGWKKTVYEPFLALLPGENGTSGRPVVCFRHLGRLHLYDTSARNFHLLTREEERLLTGDAWTLLRPFDSAPVNLKSALRFCSREVSAVDVLLLLLTMYAVTQMGLLLSTLSRLIYDQAIPQNDAGQASVLCGMFLVALVANLLFMIGQNLTRSRLSGRLTHSLQAAVYDRAFHLSESFFRGQESAAMAHRIYHLAGMYVSVINSCAFVALQLGFSLFYVSRMFNCSPQLAGIGLALAGLEIVLTVVRSIAARRFSMQRMSRVIETRSLLYQAFSGVATVRAAGAEEHVLSRYMEKQTDMGRTQRKSDRMNQFGAMGFSLLSGMGTILIYGTVGFSTTISLGTFMAFLTANSLFAAAILQSTGDVVSIFQMLPMLKDATGILKEVPEKAGQGTIPDRMAGDVVLSHVSFSYDRNTRALQDLSFRIRPGEHVGIAGASGSGKSTLIRLLLGFSQPTMGMIYYDGVPLNRLDKTELRRRVGSVLQEGSLLSGTILQNIRITRPEASIEEVWQVLEQAAIKEEIEAMPMGLMTYVSEESQTISGGQKQRILLAQALLGNPSLLILDEATSALDNLTQETVIRNLSSLKITRITVAHRLSTLRPCDRILVLDRGVLVEEGSYDALMERKGRFWQMVQA